MKTLPPPDFDPKSTKIFQLQRELGALQQKYEHLQQTYNKLADQWNVFQATARPDNRNIQRAEGAGEMARKLAEVFLSLAYDKDAIGSLQNILWALEEIQKKPSGQEVEVGGKLVRK